MTPEKLREIAAEIMRHKSTVAVEGVVPQWLHDQLLAHADALEECLREFRKAAKVIATGDLSTALIVSEIVARADALLEE